jgi:hypothetical protein
MIIKGVHDILLFCFVVLGFCFVYYFRKLVASCLMCLTNSLIVYTYG